MHVRRALLALIVALSLAGCVRPSRASHQSTAPTLQGDPAHPAQTTGWVDTKLFFGLGPVEHPEQGVSETEWRAFLDREVTPRFPSGLSVLDVYGQWQGKNQPSPEHLRSKMLILDYRDTPENRAKIDAIRAAWKEKTGDQSVMRVTEPADVSF